MPKKTAPPRIRIQVGQNGPQKRKKAVLRIRDVYPGSDFSPYWIRIKEFKYFNPKKWFLNSRKYDPGCSARIWILTFYPSRIRGSKRPRIRICNTGIKEKIS